MKIIVFGASAGTGRLVVDEALAAGHQVTAFARRAESLDERAGLTRVKGDVHDLAAVEKALRGHDAAVIAVGGTSLGKTSLVTDAARNIAAAMKKVGVSRLLVMSHFGVGDSRPRAGFVYRSIVEPLFLKNIAVDKLAAESFVRTTDLDWTIIRPANLTNGKRTGRAKGLLEGAPAMRVSRADVAAFIVDELGARRFVRQTPGVGYPG